MFGPILLKFLLRLYQSPPGGGETHVKRDKAVLRLILSNDTVCSDRLPSGAALFFLLLLLLPPPRAGGGSLSPASTAREGWETRKTGDSEPPPASRNYHVIKKLIITTCDKGGLGSCRRRILPLLVPLPPAMKPHGKPSGEELPPEELLSEAKWSPTQSRRESLGSWKISLPQRPTVWGWTLLFQKKVIK